MESVSWRHPHQFIDHSTRYRQEQHKSPPNLRTTDQPRFFPLANIRPKRGRDEREVLEGAGGSEKKKKGNNKYQWGFQSQYCPTITG